MKSSKFVTETISHHISLTRNDLLLILKGEKKLDIPNSADIFIRVPGGGDWSNTDLVLDNVNTGLEIRWEAVSTKRVDL